MIISFITDYFNGRINPDKLKIVGIVDPDDVRTELMREKYNVPKENCFRSVDEFVQREKFADAVINGTMEEFHVSTSVPVLEKGYDLLLEKPFAVNEKEVDLLRETAKKHGSKVVICHVLNEADLRDIHHLYHFYTFQNIFL